jgi:DNA repair protein RadC
MTEPNFKTIYRIADLYESDRPRERLASLGPQALTNAELIAILLRVDVVGENAVEIGQRLLKKIGGLLSLHRAAIKELIGQIRKGNSLGAYSTIRLVSELLHI